MAADAQAPLFKVRVFSSEYLFTAEQVDAIANICRGAPRWETDWSTKPTGYKIVPETNLTFALEVVPADIVSALQVAEFLGA